MTFLRFVSTPVGRVLRVLLGAALIAVGARMDSAAGWALAAFGLLPLGTGAANICPISPLVGEPMRGGPRCTPIVKR